MANFIAFGQRRGINLGQITHWYDWIYVEGKKKTPACIIYTTSDSLSGFHLTGGDPILFLRTMAALSTQLQPTT